MDGITLSSAGIRDDMRGQIVQKDGGKLESPKHIIKTVHSARALYSQVRQQNLKRIALWASIEGLIAGNPPYDQNELDKHGLSYMTNYNDLSARSRFEKEVLAYFNLTHQADLLVNFGLDLPDPKAGEWARTLSIEGDKVLKEWEMFFNMMGTHIAQLSKLGLSVVLWSDERDWRPRTIEMHRFSVADQTETNMDQLTFCFLENDFTAQYLMSVYEELSEKDSASIEDAEDYTNFWNLQTLGNLLVNRANTIVKPNNFQFYDVFQLQKALQDGDYTYTQLFGDGIKLVTLLYKEYDGWITHYMFDMVSDTFGFVYLADRQYKKFSEAVQIFTVSPSEFTLHSNRGIGHKIFAPCQAKNQLACSTVDMARHASTPMLRNQGGSVKDPQQIKMFPGVPTDIGSAELVQNNLGNNLQQVIGVLTYLDTNLSVNLGMSGDDPAIPEGSNASVGSAQARLQRAPRASLLKHHTAHFLRQLDHMYSNMFSIMLRSEDGYPGSEFALRWKKRCIAKGVPEVVFDLKDTETGLPEWMSVKATRVGGDGSMEGLLLAISDLETIAPMMGPRELAALKKDKVLATLGPDALPRYTQETDTADEVSSGASDANVENAVMQLGFPALFSRTNDHVSHFGVHMSLNALIIQKVQQQQMTPIEANKVLEMSVPHTGEHWKALVSRGEFGKSFVDKWRGPYEQVVKYYELNRKNAIKMKEAEIRKQQEQAAQQEQVLSDQQLKQFVAEKEEARKDWQTQRKEERQERESNVRADIKRKEVDGKLANDRLVAQSKASQNTLQENRQELADLTKIEFPESVPGEV